MPDDDTIAEEILLVKHTPRSRGWKVELVPRVYPVCFNLAESAQCLVGVIELEVRVKVAEWRNSG